MLSKYKKWLLQQDEQFIKELHGESEILVVFKDTKTILTLQELAELDNRYIIPEE